MLHFDVIPTPEKYSQTINIFIIYDFHFMNVELTYCIRKMLSSL